MPETEVRYITDIETQGMLSASLFFMPKIQDKGEDYASKQSYSNPADRSACSARWCVQARAVR